MGSLNRSIQLLLVLCATASYGTAQRMITGTVKDPDGAAVRGAFVRARDDSKSRITISVLSDSQGRYRFGNLTPGGYQVWAEAAGYMGAPAVAIDLSAQAATRDFTLGRGMVQWSDLSNHQMLELLPDSEGKSVLRARCLICHGFQTRVAARPRTEQGWRVAVTFMRTAMHFNLGERFTDEMEPDLISFLNDTWGLDAKVPKSPTEMAGYEETVRPLSDEGLKIVYVDYQMPQGNSFPFSATPDDEGMVWIPEFGAANRIARLDPGTGEMQEFTAPHQGTAAIHSAVRGPDGSVWMAQQGSNKVGKWDPETETIIEYQAEYEPGRPRVLITGSKHTTRVDSMGNVWSTGYPFTKFDPRTEEFTYYREAISTYDVTIDAADNAWFTINNPSSHLGKVDARTDEVTMWELPTESYLRRLRIDSEGMIWIGQYSAGKLARFDPNTETFQEYQLPGPAPTPYALGIDLQDRIWYSSHDMDVVGVLDPVTGQVTEYPVPYPENTMKEFFLDAQGRMWWGSPPNNKVGYFTIAGN